MNILVDTNVIIRLVDEKDPQNATALLARRVLLRDGHSLFACPQNLMEFWAVCTRPIRANGLGLKIGDTERFLGVTERRFQRLEDSDRVYEKWRELVARYSVLGRQVHDAHLVASILIHGVTHILTFNGRDFTRYAEIEVIDPVAISQR